MSHSRTTRHLSLAVAGVAAAAAVSAAVAAAPATASPAPSASPRPCVSAAEATFTHTFDGAGGRATVTVKGSRPLCESEPVTLVYYEKLGSGTYPQRMFDSDSAPIGTTVGASVTLSADVPDCRYQGDLFFGSTIVDPVTGPTYGDSKLGSSSGLGARSKGQFGAVHGGQGACETPSPTPTDSTETPTPTPTTESPTPSPTTESPTPTPTTESPSPTQGTETPSPTPSTPTPTSPSETPSTTPSETPTPTEGSALPSTGGPTPGGALPFTGLPIGPALAAALALLVAGVAMLRMPRRRTAKVISHRR